MKKLLALSAVALLSTSAFANTTQTVHITGQVNAQTCVLDGIANQFVRLNPVMLADLEKDLVNPTQFSVNFKDCDTKTTQAIVAHIDPNHSTITDAGYLRNTNKTTNASTGVGIKLLRADNNQVINLKAADATDYTAVVARPATQGKLTFTFKADYVKDASNGTPSTGIVTTNVPVTIKYQ